MAAPVAMDADQLRALIAGVAGAGGGRRKPAALKTVDGLEWQTWRRLFDIIRQTNHWDNMRSRREAAAALEGEAARAVADIPLDIGHALAVPDESIAYFLNQYEARFLTVGDQDTARIQFRATRQKKGENLTAWHGRLRELYRRAYPAQTALEIENSSNLIERFIMGLTSDAACMEHILDQRPGAYAAALNLATAKQATVLMMETQKKKQLRGEPRQDVLALGFESSSTCFFCDQAGHFKRECPLWAKAQRELGSGARKTGPPLAAFKAAGRGGQSAGRATARGRGFANRSPARGRGGGGRGGREGPRRQLARLINALGLEEEDEDNIDGDGEEESYEAEDEAEDAAEAEGAEEDSDSGKDEGQ